MMEPPPPIAAEPLAVFHILDSETKSWNTMKHPCLRKSDLAVTVVQKFLR